MSVLNLSPDQLLTTTRAVRKRLDLSRLVEPEVIRECLELAVQAPTGTNSQAWHFVIVTDPRLRETLGAIYRKGFATYLERTVSSHPLLNYDELSSEQIAGLMKLRSSALYLVEHMHEVPVLVIPCIRARADSLPNAEQAGVWGSIMPATWSFMLAARARGLGTCWTSVHLYYEQEAAEALGIPYEKVSQAALIPVAYTVGADFKPAPRIPLESVVHWDQW